MVRAVAHPSYQAYSYAKIIENFSATVQDKHIDVELEKSTSFFTSSVSTFFKPG
jgi:hypothetical protein